MGSYHPSPPVLDPLDTYGRAELATIVTIDPPPQNLGNQALGSSSATLADFLLTPVVRLHVQVQVVSVVGATPAPRSLYRARLCGSDGGRHAWMHVARGLEASRLGEREEWQDWRRIPGVGVCVLRTAAGHSFADVTATYNAITISQLTDTESAPLFPPLRFLPCGCSPLLKTRVHDRTRPGPWR